MAKWVHSDVLDNGISAIKANANKQVLLKAYVPGDSYSTVNGTNKLAEVAMASGDYTLGSGSGSSRTLTTAAGKSATASASSGASPDLHIAFVDTVNSKVLWVTETSNASVTAGDTVNFPVLPYTADQPPGAMSAMSQYVDEVAAGRGATLGSAQQQQIQALVSGGGIGPSSTFASLPSAAENAGMSYRVTDVGPVGCGSIWISDGTRWRPLGGRQLHCAASGTLAAPLVTLSGAAGKFTLPAGDRVTAGSILLPVGLPQIGQGVEVSAKVLHRGTAGTWNFVGRLGSLDTSSDPSFMQVTGAATNDQSCWLHQDMEVVSATSFVASTFAVPNQAGTGAVVLRNSNFNNAAQLYLSFYSSTFTAGDFIDLISYRVYLIG